MRISDWSSVCCSSDLIGLLATGGSTNHAIHLPAIARAAVISVDWTDFAELSAMVPLLARVYPNGSGDVNHFHAAGGMAWVISQLLDAGLLHRDIMTVARADLTDYGKDPVLENEEIGRASCRERVGQYVKIWVGAVSLKKKKGDNRKKR